jgi:hypothetical protein
MVVCKSHILRTAMGVACLVVAAAHLPSCAESARRDELLEAAGSGRHDGTNARQDLLELNRAEVYPFWLYVESEHFILFTPPDGPVAGDPEAFLQRREEAHARIVETLEVEPAGPIIVFAYASSRQGERLLGRPLAFADPARREIHVRHDQEPGHEEAHVIAWAWNSRGSGVPFLEEGLAVAMSAHPGNPQVAAGEILARDALPAWPDLVERFSSYRNAYALAGSFVEMLMERFGVSTVRELYIGGPENFTGRLEKASGMSASQLQAWWETMLAAQEPVTREPIVAAITLIRLGDMEGAIRLLERSKQEMPSSPVVEYALALARRESGDLEASAASYRRVLRMPVPYHLAWVQARAREALEEMGREAGE